MTCPRFSVTGLCPSSSSARRSLACSPSARQPFTQHISAESLWRPAACVNTSHRDDVRGCNQQKANSGALYWTRATWFLQQVNCKEKKKTCRESPLITKTLDLPANHNVETLFRFRLKQTITKYMLVKHVEMLTRYLLILRNYCSFFRCKHALVVTLFKRVYLLAIKTYG